MNDEGRRKCTLNMKQSEEKKTYLLLESDDVRWCKEKDMRENGTKIQT